MPSSVNILKEIKHIITSRFPTAKVYLYGSRVKGQAHRHSDWDLLILLNNVDAITPEIEESITYPLFDLEFETGEMISPTVYTEKEWYNKYKITPFHENVMKEGELL